MAETIPGGAFLAAKNTPDAPDRWIDCDGKPLPADQVRAAKALAAERADALTHAERDRQALEVSRNPAAMAIAAALAPKPAFSAKPKD